MKSYRIPVVLSILLVSLGLLTLFVTAVNSTVAAPAQQEGGQIEANREAGRANSLPLRDTGGPDGFGYTFIDSNEPGGPIYSFVEISSTGTAFPLPDNSLVGPLSLGFDFNFYGVNYSEVSAASNGYLWFNNGVTHAIDSTPDCPLPNTLGNENYIAALHDDLDGQQNVPNGMGYYQAFAPSFCPYGGYGGACFIVEWDGTYHDTTTDDLTFQVILFDDHNFIIQYEDAGNEAGSASTTGIENGDASIALTYACDTAASISDTLAILYEAPAIPILGSSFKSGPPAITTGMPITYELILINTGIASSTNTVLTDPIPVGTTYIANSLSCTGGTGSCTYSPGDDAIIWGGSIDVGETVTVEFAVDTSANSCGAVINNVATLTDPDAFGSPYTLQSSTGLWDILTVYDFEADDGGFIPGYTGFPGPSDWEWGVPTVPPDLGATSGTNVWATILDGPHNNNNGSSLLTKTVDLSGFAASAQLFWSHYLQANNSGFDFGTVRINGDTVFDSSGQADTPDWTTQSVPVGAYVGGTADIVFDFFATAGTNDFGWYIDDVVIASCTPPATPVFDNSSKTAPGTVFSGDVYTYTVNINNTGGVDAVNTVMTDTIPAGTTYVPGSATNGAIFNSGLNQIEWTGTVSATTSVDVSFMVTATLGSGVVTNTAVISHTDIMTPVMVSATTTVVGGASYPVCADFETGVLPPFMYAETTSNGAANGRVAVTTAFPHTGLYGLDLDTDCNNCGGNTQQAAIMIVDLAGQSNVSLDFWVFEHFDENHPEDGVFISDDGGATWALIQSLNNFPASYQQVTIDLDAAVANAGMSYVDGFLIKFQSLDGATIPGNDGYSFDDICVEPGVPDIDVTPATLESTQSADEVVTKTLTIANSGSGTLNWDIVEAPASCAAPADVPWVSVSPTAGTTPPGGNSMADVAFDSTGLTTGVYTGNLCVNSDDPDEGQITVPLTLTVQAVPDISVNPAALSSTQEANTTVTETFQISNNGDADLNWTIVEETAVVAAPAETPTFRQPDGPPAETANGHTAPAGENSSLGNGPTITSTFTTSPPTIDGSIGGAEWAGALSMDITLGGAPVIMYIMHDATTLYLAFDDQVDTTLDGFDQIGVYFDDEGGTPPILWDNLWTNSACGAPNTGEGNFWLGNFTPDADDQWRAWIVGPTACTVQFGGTNTQIAYSAATGHLQYEASIPIDGSSALVAGLGETFGLRVYTAHTGATFTGRWPNPSVFNDPSTYGNLHLPAGDCVPGDIPWASASPTSGTTPPSSSDTVEVTFDSTGLAPGTYNGDLCIDSNDPDQPQVRLPLDLTVTGPGNTPPVAVGDSYTVTENSVLNVPAPGVLGNDSDVDGDPLTAVLDTDVSNGILLLNPDGSFTYTPNGGFVGVDTFTYHANDGTADSNTVTVSISVEPEEVVYKLYMAYISNGPLFQSQAGEQAAAAQSWLLITLSALPMVAGMFILHRRKE